MRNRLQILAAAIFGVLLCFALPAFGQNSNLSFNGGYQGDVWCSGSEGCVATGLYDGTINGQQVGPGGAGGLGMICDDYSHNIYTGESWTANGINVSGLNAGNINSTQFGATIGLTGYTELAYVVNLMFTTNPSSAQQSIYSQVLWALTGGVSTSQLSSGALTLYNWVIANCKTLPSLSTYANLMLYTPTDQTMNGPQEMWGQNMQADEGGAALLYILLAGVACFVAVYSSRNQRVKRAMA
ncbi:MAG: hypothetical protein WA213_08270 [Terriglobales bacterium]